MVPGFSDPRCPPLLNVTNYPTETRHQELAVTDLISQILGASTFCCCFFTHNKARAANLKIVERFGDSALSFFHFFGVHRESSETWLQLWTFLESPWMEAFVFNPVTGGQLQGLEAAACALSQQCGWWHSTEKGFTGPGIRESSSTSLGKVFRGCVETCRVSKILQQMFLHTQYAELLLFKGD